MFHLTKTNYLSVVKTKGKTLYHLQDYLKTCVLQGKLISGELNLGNAAVKIIYFRIKMTVKNIVEAIEFAAF